MKHFMKMMGIFTFSILFLIVISVNAAWERVKPSPTIGVHYNDVWGASPDNVYYVADEGVITRFNSADYTHVESGTTSDLNQLWGNAADNIFIVGDEIILHWDGISWVDMQSTASFPLYGAYIDGFGSDVYVTRAHQLLHWDGVSWSILLSSDEVCFGSLRAFSDADIFVRVDLETTQLILHWNGAEWSVFRENNPYEGVIDQLWGTSSANLFLSMNNSRVPGPFPLHYIEWYDGTNWSSQSVLRRCTDFAGNSDNIWSSGEVGAILSWNGSAWDETDSLTPQTINALWVASSGEVFAVAENGVFLNWNGNEWSEHNLYDATQLNAIWFADRKGGYAVGETGALFHWDGDAWSKQEGCTTASLNAVWGTSIIDVFAVGDAGTIIHWNGSSWDVTESGTTKDLNSVWGSGSDDVFTVGVEGTILHFDGVSWTQIESPTEATLLNIHGSSSDNIIAVGSAGTIVRWDGVSWEAMPNPYEVTFLSVWVFNDHDIYIGGDGDTCAHWNGNSWEAIDFGLSDYITTYTFSHIWGQGTDDIYIYVQGLDINYSQRTGYILHKVTATEWDWIPTYLTNPLDMGGAEHKMVFMLHDDGVMYRRYEYPVIANLELATSMVHPGEEFWVNAQFENFTLTALSDEPTFCVLETYGAFYFYPHWSFYFPPAYTDIDYALIDFPHGEKEINFVPSFEWPDTGSEIVTGLVFYAGTVTDDLSALSSNLVSHEFGYGP